MDIDKLSDQVHDLDKNNDDAQYATNQQLKALSVRVAAVEAVVNQIALDMATIKRTTKDTAADMVSAANEVKKMIGGVS